MKNQKLKVYLGADHRGFELKEKLKGWLESWGYGFEDLGAKTFDPTDDYPLYARNVALVIGKEKESRGILLCGSGIGVDIVANKIDGVRAAIGKTSEQVRTGRNDDDVNILVLAADYTDESEAKEMIDVFLETEFSGKERYVRRLKEIEKIEASN